MATLVSLNSFKLCLDEVTTFLLLTALAPIAIFPHNSED